MNRTRRSLHNEIMNLHAPMLANPVNKLEAYKIGHRDARHAAAELAAEHEDVNNALVDALEQAVTSMLDSGYNPKSAVVRGCQRALDLAYGETQ